MKTDKFCVDCVHRDVSYDIHFFKVDVCRAQAARGRNPVTGVEEWQGRTLECGEARSKGNDSCGPAGKLFKPKPMPKSGNPVAVIVKTMFRLFGGRS